MDGTTLLVVQKSIHERLVFTSDGVGVVFRIIRELMNQRKSNIRFVSGVISSMESESEESEHFHFHYYYLYECNVYMCSVVFVHYCSGLPLITDSFLNLKGLP